MEVLLCPCPMYLNGLPRLSLNLTVTPASASQCGCDYRHPSYYAYYIHGLEIKSQRGLAAFLRHVAREQENDSKSSTAQAYFYLIQCILLYKRRLCPAILGLLKK